MKIDFTETDADSIYGFIKKELMNRQSTETIGERSEKVHALLDDCISRICDYLVKDHALKEQTYITRALLEINADTKSGNPDTLAFEYLSRERQGFEIRCLNKWDGLTIPFPLNFHQMTGEEIFLWITHNYPKDFFTRRFGVEVGLPPIDAETMEKLMPKHLDIMGRVKLGFKKLDPRAEIPSYAHIGDAGMDIKALDDVSIPLWIPTMVHTGIAAEIPNGYEIQVRPRSGLACKGVTVWNSPGTVDSKYRGEICVILVYINSEVEELSDGSGTVRKLKYDVKAGDRIAQLVIAPVTFAAPYEVTELSETERGTGGFGSTGV